MKYVKGGWVNKNVMNANNHHERIQRRDEFPKSARRFRREFERLFGNKK